MSFLKLNTNLVGAAVIAAAFAFVPATASANPPAEGALEMAPPAETSPASHGSFKTADLNGDGSLDLSEFTLFAGDKAVSGDADFTAIVSSGDYETAFKLMDADGSGGLSAYEVSGHSGEDDNDMAPEGEVEPESDY